MGKLYTYRGNCSVCAVAKKDPKFRLRVRKAAFDRTIGDETLQDIGKEFDLSLPSMYNHAKKHIFDASDEYKSRRATILEKKKVEFQGQVAKELDLVIDADTITDVDTRPMEIIGLDNYIEQGNAMIRNNELKLTPQSYLAAVKIKSDWAAKQTNNKIELLRTISAFRSGSKKIADKDIKTIEGEVIDGATREITGSVDKGSEESYNIYRRAFGREVTRGTEEVHQPVVET